MKKNFFLLWLFLIPFGFAQNNYNFKKVIYQAKIKVFPALVFVKPIREVFTSGKKQSQQVFGSGVIISSDGYVVTNHHVVENATSIKCVLSDKRQVESKLIGLDKDTDLALIKLKLSEKLPYAKFGDSSKLEEGQFVMAMGSPFGFSRSISFGIVSYTKRYLETGPYNLWIQTDAAINPGNSGGPLVNDYGEVIGINTLGIMSSNIAFAIPANTVKKVAMLLKRDGKVLRTWTGITFQALKDYSKETIIPEDKGVIVASVDIASPASRAGIKTGDIILKCNGKEINGTYIEELPKVREFFSELPISSTVKIIYKRKKNIYTTQMTLKAKGEVKGEDLECPRWDMAVKSINKFANPNVAFFKSSGVFIQGVKTPGNAKLSGLKRGDIILTIEGKKITSAKALEQIYKKSLTYERKKILFKVLRKGQLVFMVLDYRRDFKKMEEDN